MILNQIAKEKNLTCLEIRVNNQYCLLCPKIYGPKSATLTLQCHLESRHDQEAVLKFKNSRITTKAIKPYNTIEQQEHNNAGLYMINNLFAQQKIKIFAKCLIFLIHGIHQD